MGVRYTAVELLQLRQSPLVVKPIGLPPAEEWMGPPQENARNQAKSGGHSDRSKGHEAGTGVENRRPTMDRHTSRSSANPEDIILGPPKTSFASANPLRTPARQFDMADRPPLPRDPDSRDRFNFRRVQEGEADRSRDGRTNMRTKRVEGDQDSEGWSTVKPRKSFGAEGAERFNGRMGGDRQREDKRFRDREDRDKQPRGFDTFTREKDLDQDQEGYSRRNGGGRGRNEPSWFKDNNDAPGTPGERKSNGDKFSDRSRGWREKDDRVVDRDRAEDRGFDRRDRGGERGGDRGERRWDRDTRQERDPEWMDEPADERKQAHTQEDFQKWKERMKAGNAGTPADEELPKHEMADNGGQSSFFGLEKPKVETPLIMDPGPDKFFGMWSAKQDTPAEGPIASKKEGVSKANTVGKASRFTSFFSAPQEDNQRRQTEPPPAIPPLPPPQENSKEKEDFQKLLQKLQSQSFGLSSPSPSANAASQPKPPPPQDKTPLTPISMQESFQQYRPERQESSRSSNRDSQQQLQDLLAHRQSAGSSASARPEQMLQELVNQRQNALSQASSRTDQPPNRNAEFLMGLMQNARAAPEPMRTEQLMLRMPPSQQQADRQLQQMAEREQELQREQRERSASQRQRRPEVPPGFYDDSAFQRGPQPQQDLSGRSQPQPTQILQRPPPGLDQQPPPGWTGANSQLPPPMSQQRHIPPPPGLAGGPNRGMPMPQGMFPPGFPGMGGFPPPDGMSARNMPPPPPGFMMPPPGFINGPPMNTFPGPDSMPYGPFDGRGAPPLGNFRRP